MDFLRTVKRYGVSGKQGRIQGFDGVRVENAGLFPGCRFVKGGDSPRVRGGGDDGLPAADAGQPARQAVAAAQVAGKQGNEVGAGLRTANYRRVRGLVPEQGSRFPDGNSRGPDENVRVKQVPLPGKQRVEVLRGNPLDTFRFPGPAYGMDNGFPQGLGNLLRLADSFSVKA